MVDRYVRSSRSRNVADPDLFKKVAGRVIVGTLDFDPDPLSSAKQNAIGADLDIEFIDPVGI